MLEPIGLTGALLWVPVPCLVCGRLVVITRFHFALQKRVKTLSPNTSADALLIDKGDKDALKSALG